MKEISLTTIKQLQKTINRNNWHEGINIKEYLANQDLLRWGHCWHCKELKSYLFKTDEQYYLISEGFVNQHPIWHE